MTTTCLQPHTRINQPTSTNITQFQPAPAPSPLQRGRGYEYSHRGRRYEYSNRGRGYDNNLPATTCLQPHTRINQYYAAHNPLPRPPLFRGAGGMNTHTRAGGMNTQTGAGGMFLQRGQAVFIIHCWTHLHCSFFANKAENGRWRCEKSAAMQRSKAAEKSWQSTTYFPKLP